MGSIGAKPTDLHEAFSYSRVFPTGEELGGWGVVGVPHQPKIRSSPLGKSPQYTPPPTNFYFLPTKSQSPQTTQKFFKVITQ